MDFTEFDIEFLSQKLAENPQSPLFARLADLYLETEKGNEALQLCEEGVKLFPDYYAGFLVLGKVYLHFKEYSKARTALTRAQELSPFSNTIKKFLNEIPDKPDESTRVTDETYFSPSSASFTPTGIAPFESDEFQLPDTSKTFAPPVSDEPLPSLFDMLPEEEQPKIEPEAEQYSAPQVSYTPEPISQYQYQEPEPEPVNIPEAMQQIISQPISHSQFPASFEEYFEQQQNVPLDGPVISLDDYLTMKVSSNGGTKKDDMFSPPPAAQQNFDTASIEHSVENYFVPDAPQMETPSIADQFSIPESTTDIDMLAEKLQNVERIKPQEHYEPPKPITQQEEQTAYESDMVTPTLAEIYASQGEFGAAIQAYEILQFSQPENSGKYQQRIRELQQKQLEKDGLA